MAGSWSGRIDILVTGFELVRLVGSNENRA